AGGSRSCDGSTEIGSGTRARAQRRAEAAGLGRNSAASGGRGQARRDGRASAAQSGSTEARDRGLNARDASAENSRCAQRSREGGRRTEENEFGQARNQAGRQSRAYRASRKGRRLAR